MSLLGFTLCSALKDLRRRARDPLALLLWLAIPAVIGGLMSSLAGGSDGPKPRAHILLVDQDESFITKLLGGAGDSDDTPFAFESVDLETGHERINSGDGSALLVIPEGFDRAILLEEPAKLELVINPAQRVLPQMVEEALDMLVEAHFYVHRVAGSTLARFGDDPSGGAAVYPNDDIAAVAVEFNEIGARLADWVDPLRLEVEVVVESEQEAGADAASTPAIDFGAIVMASILAMTVIFSALGLSEDLWVEKKTGTLLRAQAAPRPLAGWLGGKLIAHAVLFAVLITGGMLIGRYGFEIDFTGELLGLLWMTLAATVFVTLLLLAQSLARTQRAGTIVASLFVYPLLMIGGAFFPLEAMPDGLAAIGERTPVGWALERFKSIIAGVAEIGPVMVDLGVLLVVGAALFTVTLRRLPSFSAR